MGVGSVCVLDPIILYSSNKNEIFQNSKQVEIGIWAVGNFLAWGMGLERKSRTSLKGYIIFC